MKLALLTTAIAWGALSHVPHKRGTSADIRSHDCTCASGIQSTTRPHPAHTTISPQDSTPWWAYAMMLKSHRAGNPTNLVTSSSSNTNRVSGPGDGQREYYAMVPVDRNGVENLSISEFWCLIYAYHIRTEWRQNCQGS